MTKPTKFPRWADDPPVGPTTITEPSEPEKDDGWQASGKPIMQHMNWLQNLAYLWFVWIDNLTNRVFSVLFGDQALPDGTPPVTGSGFSVSAAAFSARVVSDGHLGALVSSPAYTLAANKDSYFDLGSDGVWTRVVVNSGDPAPAVTALSQRVYMIRTDGTDRTAVTNFRLTYAHVNKVLDFDQIRLGEYKRGSTADLNLARLYARFKNASSGYTRLWGFDKDGGSAHAGGLYYRHAARELVFVNGATYDPATDQWTLTSDTIGAVATLETLGGFQKASYSYSGSSPFDDSVWFADGASGSNLYKRQDFAGSLGAGTDLDGTDYERSSLFRFIAKIFGGGDREAAFDAKTLQIYSLPDSSQGTEGAGNGGEIPINCTWNSGTGKWNRVNAAVDFSLKIDMADGGFTIWSHLAGDIWDDEESAGNWTKVFQVDADGDTLPLSVTPQLDGLTGTPAIDTLYTDNILKACGKITTDGAGGFTVQSGFNYTPTIVGGGAALRITLTTPMATAADLAPHVSGPGGAQIVGYSVVDNTKFDISLTDMTGGTATALRFDNAVRTVSFEVTGSQ